MGLGKTLTLLALICSSLDNVNEEGRTLIIAPKSSMLPIDLKWDSANATCSYPPLGKPGQKVRSFADLKWYLEGLELANTCSHIKDGHLDTVTYLGSNRSSKFSEAHHSCQIVLTTYETMRVEWPKGPLHLQQWHRVILDEGSLDFLP